MFFLKKLYAKSLSISNEFVVSCVDRENSLSQPGGEATRKAEASFF